MADFKFSTGGSRDTDILVKVSTVQIYIYLNYHLYEDINRHYRFFTCINIFVNQSIKVKP